MARHHKQREMEGDDDSFIDSSSNRSSVKSIVEAAKVLKANTKINRKGNNIEIVKHGVIKHKNTVVGLKNVNQSFLDKVKIQKEQKSVSGSQPNIDTDEEVS